MTTFACLVKNNKNDGNFGVGTAIPFMHEELNKRDHDPSSCFLNISCPSWRENI